MENPEKPRMQHLMTVGKATPSSQTENLMPHIIPPALGACTCALRLDTDAGQNLCHSPVVHLIHHHLSLPKHPSSLPQGDFGLDAGFISSSPGK